jgi:hypothetical protein
MRLFLYFFSTMLLRLAIVILLMSTLAACGNMAPGSSENDSTKVSLEEGVVDQIQGPVEILYFRKPFTDSVRYTRYYKVAQTTDSVFFASLKKALQQTHEKLEAPRECLSEGKIQIPLGGDAFKVVYFSRSKTGCAYLYIIMDGAFFYYEMPAELNNYLVELEKQSKDL